MWWTSESPTGIVTAALLLVMPTFAGAMVTQPEPVEPRAQAEPVPAQAPPPLPPSTPDRTAERDPQAARPQVRVAHLVYGEAEQSTVCFSAGYLTVLDRNTTLQVDRLPARVPLGDDRVFDFPFAVMSGEGDFSLTEHEIETLRTWLETGGFLLASAGCSDPQWDAAFRREFARVYAAETYPLVEVGADHEVFRVVFDIAGLQTRQPGEPARLEGLSLDGRLCVLYSPQGLNDSGNAGGGCCCCGGSEIRHAKYLNANALAYTLLH